MQCRSCGTRLPVGAAFCPTCGVATLSNVSGSGVSPYDPTAAPSPPGAPPQESPLPPTQYASPPYGVSLQNPYEQLIPYTVAPPPPPLLQLRTRIVGRTILSLFSYLWGVFWLSFGLAGLFLHAALNTIVALVFVACCIVGLVILIFLLRFRKYLYLGARRRLLLEIGLTLIGFLFLIFFSSVLTSPSPTLNIALGSVCVIYGLIAAFVAYW